jgi:2-oxoisovalerate dehydrogenase E1 component
MTTDVKVAAAPDRVLTRRERLLIERLGTYHDLVRDAFAAETLAAPEMTRPQEALDGLSRRDLLDLYAIMVASRELDKLEAALQKQGQVWFTIPGAGKEAINVAFGRALSPEDGKMPYYRDRALALACGVSPFEMLCQAMAKREDPASGGRQMPSHWGHKDFGIVSQSSCTGSQCIPAVGLAEGLVRRQQLSLPREFVTDFERADAVVYVSLGDGTTAEGEVEEALREACRTQAPVVFVIEDDAYAISTPVKWNVPGGSIPRLYKHYEALGMRVLDVDGTSFLESYRVARFAVDHGRQRAGPVLVHAHVTRPMSHSSTDTQSQYRPAEEIAQELNRDPLLKTRDLIIGHDPFSRSDEAFETALRAGMNQLEGKIQSWLRRETERARRAAPTDTEHILDHRYAGDPEAFAGTAKTQAEPPLASKLDPEKGQPIEMRYAINEVLREAMRADPRILVFGEDVADVTPLGKRMKLPAKNGRAPALEGKGGVFHVTRGLQKEFGPERVWNSPLAEATILGMATGYSLAGFLPVPEIQFRDYVHPGWQQLVDEAATLRWRSNGTWKCPMIVRMAYGGYLGGAGAIWHSEAGVSQLANVPGVRVVVPAGAWDAAALLRAALASDEIVLFLEPKALYSARGAFPPPPQSVPLGKAYVARDGADLTVITYGNLLPRCLEAAERLAALDVEVAVVDLRTVDAGWDVHTVLESVRRTRRAIVVDEDRRVCGFGDSVIATLAETAGRDLVVPLSRVCARHARVSYGPTGEASILPQTEDIVAAVRDALLKEED